MPSGVYRKMDLSNTKQEVIASSASLTGWHIANTGAAETHVHLYNALAANVTVGTTTPTQTIVLLATSGIDSVSPADGIFYGTGITVAATQTDGSSAPATAIKCNLFYRGGR